MQLSATNDKAVPPSVNDESLESLRRRAALADELVQILKTPAWSPTERIAYMGLRVALANGERVDGWREKKMPVWDMAQRMGLPKRTASDTLKKLKAAKLADWTVERPTGDDYDKAETTFKVTDKLPRAFEQLPTTKNGNESKRRAAEFRAEKARLQRIVSELACPECGVIGCLHVEIGATCGECNHKMTPAELDKRISGPQTTATNRRKLRGLKGKETPPAPGLDHDHFEDAGIEVGADHAANFAAPPHAACIAESVSHAAMHAAPPMRQTLPHGEALSVVPDGVPTLTGQAAVDHLAALGGMFSLADSQKHGVNPRDDMGAPLNYLDCPLAAESQAVRAHLAAGGSIGLLPPQSGQAVLDADLAAAAFIQAHPRLALADRVFRRNAPDRVKIIVLCPDPGESQTFVSADGTRKIELIGKGKHAIVAGKHETGAAVELAPGHEAVLMTWAELVAIAEAWTGDKKPANTLSVSKPHPTQSAAAVRSSGDQLRDAIAWWIAQPANQAEVDRLLSACPKRGQYVSVRASDGTPSTRRTDTRAGYHKRTWRDYGSNETLDDYELYCRLSGLNKGTHKWQVVNEWRVAHGRPPLNPTRPTVQGSRHEHFERTPREAISANTH